MYATPGESRTKFERPILELERQISELRQLAAGRDRLANLVSVPPQDTTDLPVVTDEAGDLSSEIGALEARSKSCKKRCFQA